MQALSLIFAAISMAKLCKLCSANLIPEASSPTKHRKIQRRRLQLNLDDEMFDEMFEPQKDRPCILDDGSIFIPDGYSVVDHWDDPYGDRRKLQRRTRDNGWERCREGTGKPRVTSPPSSVATKSIDPSSDSSDSDDDDHRLKFIVSTRQVLQEGQKRLVEVIAALPKVDRRKLGGKYMNAARNFRPKMIDSLAYIIENATDFQVKGVFVNGEDRPQHVGSSSPEWSSDEINENKIVLVRPRLCNVTKVSENDHVSLWKYSVNFITFDDDEASKKIEVTCHEAIRNGALLQHLKTKFKRMVDVCLPGEEKKILPTVSPITDGISTLEDSWDIYQWVGLVLFSITIIATIALTKTAQRRRKNSEKQENWGVALATEKDINQLLTYGWEFQGNQVRAFDKTKMIYQDDDSMLIGGMHFGNAIQPEDGTPTEAVTTESPECPTERSPSSNMDSSGPSTETTGLPDADQAQSSGRD
eukprot:CAMPEP_0178914782 /NCGR_PEP_ID=MMETSP0786-20121207/11633_1 /TAXON_ID=186022 /ORGANISM="Thalassionema frauenfeldii, Strain CCMP 1798" /LENGTH=471 /DNA_ID=CAMNT_0020587761 /DNA_START=435 /DNA_END=1850 /DNA_ORIENTATION=+